MNEYKPEGLLIKTTKNDEYISSIPDLIVTADMPIYQSSYFNAKTLYINHGTSTISFNNNTKTAYSYHVEQPIFDLYLESSKAVVDHLKTTPYKDKVVFSGHKYSDKICEQANNYEIYRELLGIKPNQKAIFLIGSWRANSLFHKLGKPVFEKIKELSKTNEYKFILSIHPNEYLLYDYNVEPFGKYVDELKSYGAIVRNPGENPFPFITASDLVITDFSSMGDNAALAGKPIIYSQFDTSNLFFLSISSRLYDKVPKLNSAEDLEEIIKQPYSEESMNEINKIKNDMLTNSGFYGDICRNCTKSLLFK